MLLDDKSQGESDNSSPHIDKALWIITHAQRTLGPIYSTISFNMIDSGEPLTIIIVKPTKKRNFYTLVTAGMSYKAMVDPKDLDKAQYYSELVLGLPSVWKAPKSEADIPNLEDKDKWPLLLLLTLAEFPHKTKTYLAQGHTVSLGGNYQGFSHAMFNFTLLGPEFEIMLEEKTDNLIFFLGVYPITNAEFDFKKQYTSEKLFEGLIENNVTLVFDADKKRIIRVDSL